jgi:hypothetical protein
MIHRSQGRSSVAPREGRARATTGLFSGCLLSAAFFAVSCGSSLSGSKGNSCSSTSPSPPPSATDAGATSQEAVEAPWLTWLDDALGRWLRGDVLAYRGTIQGSTTVPYGFATTTINPPTELTIAQESALGSLDFFPVSANDWISMVPAPFASGNEAVLIVHGLADSQSMAFGQPDSDPTMTASAGIVQYASSNYLWATCSDCAPSFWARPAALAFDLTANGTVTLENYDGSTMDEGVTTTASVQLSLVSPCDLTFADLTTLNVPAGPDRTPYTSLTLFTLTGSDWVYHVTGSVSTGQPPPQGACSGGVSYFDYTLDLYVNAANVADYGVRNYAAGAPYVECPMPV